MSDFWILISSLVKDKLHYIILIIGLHLMIFSLYIAFLAGGIYEQISNHIPTQIKELKDGQNEFEKKVDDNFNELEKKVDDNFKEIIRLLSDRRAD